MNNNRRMSAFSLIEISIVILIVGILVAGVTQSSRLLSQAKLSSAKSMTQSAPVSSIKNLALWIESTSDDSFQSSDLDDTTAITTWKDINPQATLKASFTTVTGTPIYRTNLINGLPAVCFNSNANCGSGGASGNFLSSPNFSNLSAGSTVFAVVKLPNTLAAEPILSKRNASSSFATAPNMQLNTTAGGDWQYCDGATQATSNVTCTLSAGISTGAIKGNYVVSVVYNTASTAGATTATGITFFQNGVAGTPVTTASSPSIAVTDPLLIAKTSTSDAAVYFKGYIGEIIIFDRALKKEERQSIENYLGKKWGITMTTAAI